MWRENITLWFEYMQPQTKSDNLANLVGGLSFREEEVEIYKPWLGTRVSGSSSNWVVLSESQSQLRSIWENCRVQKLATEWAYLYQQGKSSGLEQKSWPDHLAAITGRSCEPKLSLKRCGLKFFQCIGSVQRVISTEVRLERSVRSPGAGSLMCFQLFFKHMTQPPSSL